MNKMQELIGQYAVSQSPSAMLSIIEALQQCDRLWTAYSPVTKNHYLEFYNETPTAFVFSDAAFCQAFQQFLQTRHIRIASMESDQPVRISMFSDFYRCGIEQIIVDNGQRFVVIPLTEIINRPDFSALPEQQRPVLNPALMRSANLFFQSRDAQEHHPQLTERLMQELYHARYLLPLVMDGRAPEGTVLRSLRLGGAELTLPVIARSDGSSSLPVFTDWVELSKMDKEKACVGNVVTFEEIARFCIGGDYVAVNPLGFNMVVDQTTADTVRRRFGSPVAPVPSAEPSAAAQGEPPRPDFDFYDLARVPDRMMHKLYECLNRTSGIRKAYLKGLRQNGRESYLCIVDFSGTDPSVFPLMAQEVGPLTGGLAFNFVSYDSEIGRAAVGQGVPFFSGTADNA